LSDFASGGCLLSEMQTKTDSQLLREYAGNSSEAAFGELVSRHADLVYSAALRQVNGDRHLAEDVTQLVFTDVARKARRLSGHAVVVGWLYTSTRFAAANVRREARRRRQREREACFMNAVVEAAEPEHEWARIASVLDEAMQALDEQDRLVILLRHFECRSYA